MNPSDTETSDSTSSSSLGPGLLPESAADGLSPPLQAQKEGEVHNATSAPLRIQGIIDGDESRYESQQRNTSRETGSEGDHNTTRVSVKSPARHYNTERFSTTARNQTGDEDRSAFNSSSRQRPLSAPSKAYPFARHSELSQEQTPMGRAKSRGTAVGAQGRTDDAGTFEHGGGKKERMDRDYDRREEVRGDESMTAQQRLSFSSIFGAASQRRASGNKQPKARPSLLLEGKEEGSAGFGLQERNNDEGGQIEAGAALSPQEFGLHRWKEYAVLRHGRNRRFVDSQHGREIIAEIAATIRTKEVAELNRELKEMRALVEELHSALRAEQIEKSNLQAKVVLLEREIEGTDFARRRWLREDASNRGRGSNLERRLAGNTGNLRTFLFGAGAKPETTRVATPDASLAAGTSRPFVTRSRPPVASSRGVGIGGDGGGITASESPAGDDGDRDMAAFSAATAEGNAVRRARETAELERSELRRRHDVEMSAKQSRIDRLKLEVRRLEAERDGLKQAAVSQAGLFKDGYAELKDCLEEIRSHRPSPSPPPPPTSNGLTDSDGHGDCVESGPRQHQQHQRHPQRAGSGDNDRVIIKPAEGTKDWVEIMLATEEGLKHQVMTLQSLLLGAVSAAVPTVVLPAAVTQAVDSIREGTGLPPLGYSGDSNPVLRGVPLSLSSRYPIAAIAAVSGAESKFGGLQSPGFGPSRGTGFESACGAGTGGDFPTQDRSPRNVQRYDRYPPGPAAFDTVSRSAAESIGTGECLAVHTSDAGDARRGSVPTGRNTRNKDDDDDSSSSCTGSEGSGTMWVRVAPTDENSSEEEGLDSPLSLTSKRQCDGGIDARRRRGRDETLRRYLGDGGGRPLYATLGSERRATGDQLPSPRGDAHSATCPTAERNQSQPPESGGGDAACPPAVLGAEALVRNASNDKRPGVKRDNRNRRLLAASGGFTSEGGLAGSRMNSAAASTQPCLLELAEDEGPSEEFDNGDGERARETGRSEGRGDWARHAGAISKA